MPEGLKIVVGADTKEAESALAGLTKGFDQTGQAATKLGSEFAKAFGNAPINNLAKYTAAVQNLKKSLAGVSIGPISGGGGIQTTVDQLKKVPQASNAATLSLINLSRVAQDAPFGFLGIANNLNPLLESFQRLKAESGSTSGALKSLVSSLGGAGGLGLALGVVSSLLIVFGDKLGITGSAFSKTDFEAAKFLSTLKAMDNALESLKSNIDFSQALNRLRNEIKGSEGLDLELIDIKGATAKNKEIVRAAQEQKQIVEKSIEDLQKTIVQKGGDASKLLTEFLFADEIPKNLVEKLGAANQTLFQELNAALAKRKKLNDEILDNSTDQATNQLKADLNAVKQAEEATRKRKEAADKALAAQRKYIADAKELAKELEKIGFKEPQFKFFDTIREQLAKAREVFNTSDLKLNNKFFDVDLTLNAPRPDAIQQELNTFQDAVQKGLATLPPVEIPVGLTEDQQQVASVLSEFINKYEKLGLKFHLPVELDFSGTGSQANAVLQKQLDKDINTAKIQKRFQDIVTQFSGDLFVGLGQAIGDAIGGSANVFDALFKVIAAGMKQFGEALIALGTAKLALDKLFKGPQGGILAIGAGIALIALSTVVSNFQGPKFAQGGLVTGPTLGLVGEGRGTSSSNPEVIAPLDKLKGMLSDIGGGRQTVLVMGKIRGKDLALSGARTSKSQTRLGA
jgi:hypothetical protein